MVEPDDRQHTSGLKEYEQILDDHECPLAILMQYPPSKGMSVISDDKHFYATSLPNKFTTSYCSHEAHCILCVFSGTVNFQLRKRRTPKRKRKDGQPDMYRDDAVHNLPYLIDVNHGKYDTRRDSLFDLCATLGLM